MIAFIHSPGPAPKWENISLTLEVCTLVQQIRTCSSACLNVACPVVCGLPSSLRRQIQHLFAANKRFRFFVTTILWFESTLHFAVFPVCWCHIWVDPAKTDHFISVSLEQVTHLQHSSLVWRVRVSRYKNQTVYLKHMLMHKCIVVRCLWIHYIRNLRDQIEAKYQETKTNSVHCSAAEAEGKHWNKYIGSSRFLECALLCIQRRDVSTV